MKRLLLLAALLLPSLATPQSLTNPQQSWLFMISNSKVTGPQIPWPGGIGVFVCNGTWNGATVTLQFMGSDGVTMVTAGLLTTLTANGGGVFYLPSDIIQAAVSGAGASTALWCGAGIVPAPNSG